MAISFDFFSGNLIDTGSSGAGPTIGGPVAGSTPNTVLVVDGSSNMGNIGPLTNGQLLIGSTGALPSIASLTGTTDQITVTPGAGSITLSLPQSIATTSSPHFANLTLTPSGSLDTSSAGTLAIGTATASIINIGNSGATVNIQGTTFYQNVTNLQVADKLITINKGGSAGSASNSGIEIEENSLITGYFDTTADRNSWEMKAPGQTGIITLSPGASGFTINQGSHDPVTLGTANGLSLSTQALSLAAASASTTGALTSTDWSTFNNKEPAITVLPISKGGTNSSSYTTNGVVYFDGTSLINNTNVLSINPATTTAVIGTSTSGINLGSVDAFSRSQIWNYKTNASLRLGALAQDGDFADVNSEGSVFYGANSQGTAIGGNNFGYARIKADRFGLYTSIAGTAFYYYRADPTELFLANDSNVKTFQVTRATGNTTILGTIGASNLSGTNTGDVTLGTANGLSILGQSLSLGLSSTSTTGALSSTDWNTFNGKQAALTFGNLTDVGTDGITITGGTGAVIGSGTSISQQVADATHNGYLSSTDWSTFNSKQPAGSYVTAVSVVSANGFTGSSSGGTTPALTLTTSITGVLKGDGTAISAAVSGTDYSAGTSALATGILKSTTTTGALSIAVAGDFPTLNQNTTGSAGSISASNVITNANLSQVATQTFKGRTTAGTGNVEDLTATQATAILNAMIGDSGAGGTKGLVPAPAIGDSTKFLRGDGTWAASGGGFAYLSSNTSVYGGTNTTLSFTGANNTIIGPTAGNALTSGTQNTAIGTNALKTKSTSSFSTAVGYNALTLSTGASNTAVGNSALAALTTATNCNAFGDSALVLNTGNQNDAFGFQSLAANTTGVGSAAFGYQSLNANTSSYSTAMGFQALVLNSSGQYNVAFGASALQANTTNGHSTAIGTNALYNSTGTSNTALGYNALQNITTGAHNIGLGTNAGNADTNVSNRLYIGSTTASEGIDTIQVDSTATDGASFVNKMNFAVGIGLTQIATPANPSASHNKIYPKSDGHLYILKSDATEAKVEAIPSFSSSTSLGASGTITVVTTAGTQIFRVASSGGSVTLSTTPFSTTVPLDGTQIILIGTSDANTVEIPYNDAAKGCMVNGSAILSKGRVLTLIYESTGDRYWEVSRNF